MREGRIQHAQRTDEAIALSDDGFEEARFGGVIAESGANFSDDVIDVGLRIDKKIGAPKFGDDILARNELIPAGNKKKQELHGLFLELDAASAAAKFVTAEVQFDFNRCAFCSGHGDFLRGIMLQDSMIYDDIQKIWKGYAVSIARASEVEEYSGRSNSTMEVVV